jgi:hypothetical protein
MNDPLTVLERFLISFLYGVQLGVLHGFLRPFRRRQTALADLLFVPALIGAWLRLSFAVCRGDIRLGYTAGLFLGIAAWEITAGFWLRPVFSAFWKAIFRLFELLSWPVRKFFQISCEFLKKIIASVKKSVTIKWSNHRHQAAKVGGRSNGHLFGKSKKGKAGSPPQQSAGKGGAAERGAVFYGSAAGPSRISGCAGGSKRSPVHPGRGTGAGAS